MSKMIALMSNKTSKDGGICSTVKILVKVIGLLETPGVDKNTWIFWEELDPATKTSAKSSKESVPTRMLSRITITSTLSVCFVKNLYKTYIRFETACASVKWKKPFVTY